MSGGQQGLFSSVLSFLSREVQDFVSTATGNSTSERVVASTSSRHRAKTKPKRETRHSRREILRPNEEGGDEEKEWQEQQHPFRRSARRVQPPHGTSYSPTPSPPRGTYQNRHRSPSPRRQKIIPSKKAAPRRHRRTPSPPRPLTPLLDECASHDGNGSNDAGAEPPTEEEEAEEHAPQPHSRALRRRPSMTMPGALFPRSPSMDPAPAPAAAPPQRHVHFPTQPTYFDYEVLVPSPSSSPERARPPSPSPVPAPSRSRAASVSEVTGRRAQEDAGGILSSSGAAWKEKGKQRATVVLESEAASSPARSILSGSGRGASDAGHDAPIADTSGEIRVRGKEQELSAVREERRAREQWWETETETTMIREEKVEYEDKIKKLEEEVQRLRDELAKRPAMNSADYSFSMPPPPPPPPPPPSHMSLVLPRIPTTPASAELSFSDIRAHLRHTGTPVEAPINAPPTAKKRVGQPTIGVPADKMAAFLKEMKTVRLRKVFNAPADMGREPPRASSAETSFVAAGIQRPPRPAEAPAKVGEKRKREADTRATEDVQSIKRRLMMGPLPRSADSSFRSANSSFSSQSQSLSRSQSQSQPEAGPSKPTRSYIPVRAWPSSSVDGTDVTPSLTSDGDAEQGPDEPLPRTPPQVPTVIADEPEELEVELLPPPSPPQPPTKKVTPVPRPPTPPRRNHAPSSAQGLFDKRPPRSPLPAPTPQKARPPTRLPTRRRKIPQSDEEDDPLALVALDPPPLVIRTRRPTAGPSRHARKGSASSTQSGAPSKAARRRTLDEELRRSDGVTEDDLLAFDIEPHTYAADGSASGRTRRGFLAHGGGGGVPVFMGAETVGRGEMSDDELEIIDHPSPPPPPPRRKRATNTRR